MTDDLVDELVADIMVSAMRQAKGATEDMERVTSRPELAERYGDFNLGISWQGPTGRSVRADIVRKLRDKGMSQRQIAAQVGVSKTTVHDDLEAPDTDQHHEGDAVTTDHPKPGPSPTRAAMDAPKRFANKPDKYELGAIEDEGWAVIESGIGAWREWADAWEAAMNEYRRRMRRVK